MRERSNTCCFTGHRDISAMSYSQLIENVEPLVMTLIEKGYRNFVCGGALGFDTFAAMYISSLKMRGFPVRLVLILPCRNQAQRWSEYDKMVYHGMIDRADEVIYTADSYYTGCMQKRNRAMVDASSACICYLTSARGSGTRSTVEYARAQKLAVVNVAKDAML